MYGYIYMMIIPTMIYGICDYINHFHDLNVFFCMGMRLCEPNIFWECNVLSQQNIRIFWGYHGADLTGIIPRSSRYAVDLEISWKS